jgi:hypothetical protein
MVINGRTKSVKHNGLDLMVQFQHRTQTGPYRKRNKERRNFGRLQIV